MGTGCLMCTESSMDNAMPTLQSDTKLQALPLFLFDPQRYDVITKVMNWTPDTNEYPPTSCVRTTTKTSKERIVEEHWLLMAPKSVLKVTRHTTTYLSMLFQIMGKNKEDARAHCLHLRQQYVMEPPRDWKEYGSVAELDFFLEFTNATTQVQKETMMLVCQQRASTAYYRLLSYRYDPRYDPILVQTSSAPTVDSFSWSDSPDIHPALTMGPVHDWCTQAKTIEQGVGIGNRGNFCWLSALLQVLSRNESVFEIITNYQHDYYCALQLSVDSSVTASSSSLPSASSTFRAPLVRAPSDRSQLVTPASRVAKHMKKCLLLLRDSGFRVIDICSEPAGETNIEFECCNIYSRICDLTMCGWLEQADPSEMFFQRLLEPLDKALNFDPEDLNPDRLSSVFAYQTAPVEYQGGNSVSLRSTSTDSQTHTVMMLSKGSGDKVTDTGRPPALKRLVSPASTSDGDAVRNDWDMYSALDMLYGWEDRESTERGKFQQRTMLMDTPTCLVTQLPTTDLNQKFWFDTELFLDEYVAPSQDADANADASRILKSVKSIEKRLRQLQQLLDMGERACAAAAEIEGTIQAQHNTLTINPDHLLQPFIKEGMRLAAILRQLKEERSSLRSSLQQELVNHSQYHYRLSAVIVRTGSLSDANSGHYVAYVRGDTDDRWLRCDDHNVDAVSDDAMLRVARGGANAHQPGDPVARAHLLFWERVAAKRSNNAQQRKRKREVDDSQTLFKQ